MTGQIERALGCLVVVTVCLSSLNHVLPHVLPSLVVLAVVVMVARIVLDRTRGW
ncbi:MAG: hypothetical protein ABSC56_04905 [Solirubrobacteraceae bacterium]|jgi:hypothetical protein